MHMTFEKIEEPDAKPEHPAHRAARMIKELFEENISLMESGHVFLRDGVNVNEQIERESREQIAQCEAIMKRSENMDPKLWEPAALICAELESTIGDRKAPDELDASMPEIGNYGHGN